MRIPSFNMSRGRRWTWPNSLRPERSRAKFHVHPVRRIPRGPKRTSSANSGNGLPTARSITRPEAKNPPEQYRASVPGSAITVRRARSASSETYSTRGNALGVTVASHLDEGRVAHDVCVREDAMAGDHEARA
jgi:hypothetical protein